LEALLPDAAALWPNGGPSVVPGGLLRLLSTSTTPAHAQLTSLLAGARYGFGTPGEREALHRALEDDGDETRTAFQTLLSAADWQPTFADEDDKPLGRNECAPFKRGPSKLLVSSDAPKFAQGTVLAHLVGLLDTRVDPRYVERIRSERARQLVSGLLQAEPDYLGTQAGRQRVQRLAACASPEIAALLSAALR
jgi:hypothetical protein